MGNTTMKGKQSTLSIAGFDRFAKPTRRPLFLTQMDKIVPWAELCAVVEPFYPKSRSGAGRMPSAHFIRRPPCSLLLPAPQMN
jgi:hypothetical protein